MSNSSRRRPSEGGSTGLFSKKEKAGSNRRSQRTLRGTGGAVEQLKKFGEAVTIHQKKNKSDHFDAYGEVRNPMAPASPKRRLKRVSILCNHLTVRTLRDHHHSVNLKVQVLHPVIMMSQYRQQRGSLARGSDSGWYVDVNLPMLH